MIRLSRRKWMKSYFNQYMDEMEKEDYYVNNAFDLMYNKCNFCETTSRDVDLIMDNYRPVNGALNIITGEFSGKHYYWLENEWSNKIVICNECSRVKSDRFPILGDFSSIENRYNDLNREKRLLINPFTDYPEKHFIYNKDGVITPITKKGEITVDVLDLNRTSLIEGRALELFEFEKFCAIFREEQDNYELLQKLLTYIDEESQFSGIKRYFLKYMIISNHISYNIEFAQFINTNIDRTYLDKLEVDTVTNTYFKKIKEANYFDVSKDTDIRKYFSKQRFIESVEIKNFRGIEHVNLDFGMSKSKNAPWLMILGENGVGKSSILQAISLGLMGSDKRFSLLNKNNYNFVNNKANEGFVKIKLTGMMDPIVVRFNKEENRISGENHINSLLLILSYGSTRLLSNNNRIDDYKPSWARVENLFDPFITLIDAESYMLQLSSGDFKKVKEAIESLFTEAVNIIRINHNEIKFEFANSTVKLNELSDGYQSIIALATDIMMVLKNRWRNFDAEGIVLIDELDAHLHPKWNIEIVSRLRKTFPKIQFIATTHNPLTLRGLLEDEVIVLKKSNDSVEEDLVQKLPYQKGMKIDEILTSKYFGLYDTLPELNNIFEEYYRLLIDPNPSTEQKIQINYLEKYLAAFDKIGITKRDQLFYKAIDRYLAKEKNGIKENTESIFNKEIDEIINSLKGYYKE